MALTAEQRRVIREAHEGGNRPNRQANGRYTLPLGGPRYAVLTRGKQRTPEGDYYRRIAKTQGGSHGLDADQIVRLNNGNREFLMHAGGKTLLRTFVPDNSGGQWKYTKRGLSYFQAHELVEYVVHIPVEILTTEGRQTGRKRLEMLPYDGLGPMATLSQVVPLAERNARIIQLVKAHLRIKQDPDLSTRSAANRLDCTRLVEAGASPP